jgi:bacteriorhodopsin
MTTVNVYYSLVLSVTVQIITGILDFTVLLLKVPSKIYIIKQLLFWEVIVQVIEGAFYLYWLYDFKNIKNITPKRYIDWIITTPTMLVTLICYLIFLQYRDKQLSHQLDFFVLIRENFDSILQILSLNWLMLFFGYLSEVNLIPTIAGVLLGFIPFLIYYYMIYTRYAIYSKDGMNIFLYFFFFWSLYGVAALFSYNIKNSFYNILDLFAKNFFSVFLAYVILREI